MALKISEIQKYFIGTLIITIALGTICYAVNPIIQTKFTALFLYTSREENDALGFKMFNCMLYTLWKNYK